MKNHKLIVFTLYNKCRKTEYYFHEPVEAKTAHLICVSTWRVIDTDGAVRNSEPWINSLSAVSQCPFGKQKKIQVFIKIHLKYYPEALVFICCKVLFLKNTCPDNPEFSYSDEELFSCM